MIAILLLICVVGVFAQRKFNLLFCDVSLSFNMTTVVVSFFFCGQQQKNLSLTPKQPQIN
jgi:hypothetical protein